MNIIRYEDLARAKNQALEEVFCSGRAPSPDSLAGYEWRGYNMALMPRLLGIQKFIKGFYKLDGRCEGYNMPVKQNGLAGPWIHQPSAEAPKRYAFYTVTAVDPSSADHLYPQALLIDYGSHPLNPRSGPERLLRDYLVQPDPSNPDLMLGKAYLALGGKRLFSNFFVIERLRPTNWMPN